MLEAEVAPHADWAIWHVLISPELTLRSASAVRVGVGEDAWQVRVVVQNSGFLPTQVTQKAIDRKAVRPLEAEITLPAPAVEAGAEVVGGPGEARKELGQLGGRVLKSSMLGGFGAASDQTYDLAKAEWVVRAPAGTSVAVEVRHDRAGVVRAEILLSD